MKIKRGYWLKSCLSKGLWNLNKIGKEVKIGVNRKVERRERNNVVDFLMILEKRCSGVNEGVMEEF